VNDTVLGESIDWLRRGSYLGPGAGSGKVHHVRSRWPTWHCRPECAHVPSGTL